MASKRVEFLRYDKQEKSCTDCFHNCVCPTLRDDDAERCAAYVTDVAPVVHGRWECSEYDISDYWRCSACGEDWFFEYDPTGDDTKVNYCPNCGAKMDGERRNDV